MTRAYFRENEFDEYEYEMNVKRITHVYELRHACNLFGPGFVASELHVPVDRVVAVYESSIHGSKELRHFIGTKDEKFKMIFEKYEQEEDERQELIDEVNCKNECLISELKQKRKQFAGIGTNKAKRRLNKLALVLPLAKAIRLALEIEDKNICAKDSYGEYQEKIYRQKTRLILDLCKLFKEQDWIYGVQKSEIPLASHVIYFELPTCEQISWHFTPEKNDGEFPVYKGVWDKKVNSTIGKLEVVAEVLLKEPVEVLENEKV